ncbi:MAG TPA: NADH-quinone oxidoreductase subunit I [Candidatus Obscuribacterales bacterium]
MKPVKVKKVHREQLNFWEKTYLLPIFQGMTITMKHLLANLFTRNNMPTVEYPEQKKSMPKGYRGKHRLTQRDDGTVKCVACMMCATVCPAVCIHIEAGEHEDPTIEKFPTKFDIDLLRCVYCGYCVEACPCDAIRMDSGIYTIFATKREDFIIHKEQLLQVQPQFPEDARPKQGMPELPADPHAAMLQSSSELAATPEIYNPPPRAENRETEQMDQASELPPTRH